MPDPGGAALSVLYVGGPTAVLGYGGLRFLTDPTFDPPGSYELAGLTKTMGPAAEPEELGRIDAVLLSHDHHEDNLDLAGRAFLPSAGRVLTTAEGAERLGGNAEGLTPWASLELGHPGGAAVGVTAVPAEHGPEGSEELTGPVIGFVLAAPGLPRVYVSGDNASVAVVRELAHRLGPIELAVLFAGAASVPEIDGILTLSGERAAAAALALGARAVIPLHYEGWTHFSEGLDEIRCAFAAAGIADRLVVAQAGRPLSV